MTDPKDLAALLSDLENIEADPATLDLADLVEVYGKLERQRGVNLAFQASNETERSVTTGDGRSLTVRLRSAVRALQGRPPVHETDSGAVSFEDLAELTEAAGDMFEQRAETFEEALVERVNTDDAPGAGNRGFH